jgi:hypothetical protein
LLCMPAQAARPTTDTNTAMRNDAFMTTSP